MEINSIYKKTTIFACLLCVLLAAGACLYVIFFSTADGFRDDIGAQESPVSDTVAVDMGEYTQTVDAQTEGGNPIAADNSAAGSIDLQLSSLNSSSEYIWIPVASTASSSDVVIENHYMDRQLWVYIKGSSTDFYRDNFITGNLEGISSGEAVNGREGVTLKFSLDHIYEFNSIFENNVLYIEKVSPQELYSKIVVIDPSSDMPDYVSVDNSLTPAGICLDIAAKVKSSLEDEGIHVYVTRMDDRTVPAEDCIALSAEVKPDMLIRVETSFDEDSKKYGTETVYNGTYFIPGFGSVELADMLESNVATTIGGLAGGLIEASDTDEVIRSATVPAAAVKVGYFTNAQENILLNREDYRTKIAQGITDAVLEAFDGKD